MEGKREGETSPRLGVSGVLASIAVLCAFFALARLVAVEHASRVVPGFLMCSSVAFAAACVFARSDRVRLRLTLLVGLEIALAVAICLAYIALVPLD